MATIEINGIHDTKIDGKLYHNILRAAIQNASMEKELYDGFVAWMENEFKPAIAAPHIQAIAAKDEQLATLQVQFDDSVTQNVADIEELQTKLAAVTAERDALGDTEAGQAALKERQREEARREIAELEEKKRQAEEKLADLEKVAIELAENIKPE